MTRPFPRVESTHCRPFQDQTKWTYVSAKYELTMTGGPFNFLFHTFPLWQDNKGKGSIIPKFSSISVFLYSVLHLKMFKKNPDCEGKIQHARSMR